MAHKGTPLADDKLVLLGVLIVNFHDQHVSANYVPPTVERFGLGHAVSNGMVSHVHCLPVIPIQAPVVFLPGGMVHGFIIIH